MILFHCFSVGDVITSGIGLLLSGLLDSVIIGWAISQHQLERFLDLRVRSNGVAFSEEDL